MYNKLKVELNYNQSSMCVHLPDKEIMLCWSSGLFVKALDLSVKETIFFFFSQYTDKQKFGTFGLYYEYKIQYRSKVSWQSLASWGLRRETMNVANERLHKLYEID